MSLHYAGQHVKTHNHKIIALVDRGLTLTARESTLEVRI